MLTSLKGYVKIPKLRNYGLERQLEVGGMTFHFEACFWKSCYQRLIQLPRFRDRATS